jgi:NADH-quinone oxidoreductase subunit C
LHNVLDYLKNHSTQKLDFLTTLCGLHIPANSGKELGVMYQVKNIISNYSVRLKGFFPISEPKIKSVIDLFPTANWMERQEFDFFGIEFDGHPDLRRILNLDDMDYHPMRKEYKLEDGTRDDKEDKFFGR